MKMIIIEDADHELLKHKLTGVDFAWHEIPQATRIRQAIEGAKNLEIRKEEIKPPTENA